MPIDFKRYEQLKAKVDQLRREADRAEGSMATVQQQLDLEFNCKTMEQAQALREKRQRQLKAKEQEFNIKLGEFEEEWCDGVQ